MQPTSVTKRPAAKRPCNTYPYEGYIVSVHRMVMQNRPVDPGSIQGSHRPISMRIKHRTRANDIFCVKLSINNHIVRLVHKNHTRYYTNMSDVPRSLQSWVSTINTVVLTADVFQLFIKTFHTISVCSTPEGQHTPWYPVSVLILRQRDTSSVAKRV